MDDRFDVESYLDWREEVAWEEWERSARAAWLVEAQLTLGQRAKESNDRFFGVTTA